MGEQQSTLQMKDDYMNLRSQGLSPKEIAEKYCLNPATVYKALQFIADKHGVSRDSLLVRPRSTEVGSYVSRVKHVASLDLNRLKKEDEERRQMMDEEIKKARKQIGISLNGENENG